jgi:hypothetical protein
MIRLRYALWFLATSVVLVCGCTSLSSHPLFSRLRGNKAEDCCGEVAVPEYGTAIGDGSGPTILPPPNTLAPGSISPGPPADRLQPVPTAPRTSATPSGRVRETGSLELLDK